MDSLTFLQNINTNINSAIISVLNLVLLIELTVAWCWGIYRGGTIGEATAGKIFLLTTIAAIMFRLWQSWPYEASGVKCVASRRVLGVCWGIGGLHFQMGCRTSIFAWLIIFDTAAEGGIKKRPRTIATGRKVGT
ncbi:hypothetical protein [Microcoleus sp. Pol12B4]|uniref:hypothetical protein n=1 Tax=Microcoleus sp. Pol12B4 TaxID=3055395 RepID=UPI002FD344C3